jgi:hypothetical protein
MKPTDWLVLTAIVVFCSYFLILLTADWWQKKLTEALVFYYSWRNARIKRNHKCLWRCYRDGGGGQLVTPKAMTEERAVAWVSRVANVEVYHVDFEHRMIFYRSR